MIIELRKEMKTDKWSTATALKDITLIKIMLAGNVEGRQARGGQQYMREDNQRWTTQSVKVYSQGWDRMLEIHSSQFSL